VRVRVRARNAKNARTLGVRGGGEHAAKFGFVAAQTDDVQRQAVQVEHIKIDVGQSTRERHRWVGHVCLCVVCRVVYRIV
jgi:hypothetical protein